MPSASNASDKRASPVRTCCAVLLVCLSTAARADQDVTSSDGRWKLHAKVVDSFSVSSASEALVDIVPASPAVKGCPKVSVVFEMPAHGHGGATEPAVMASDCRFHVTKLTPSMGGEWRLRLVLKDGDKSSTADFTIPAK